MALPLCRSARLALIVGLGLVHVWRGSGQNAGDKKKKLEDDPAFQRKDYQQNIEDDPGCNRSDPWREFREAFWSLSPEMQPELVLQTTQAMNLDNASLADEQAKVCMLGMITVQFVFADFLLHEAGSVEASVNVFRLLDTHAGAMHPDVLDAASRHGQLWPVTTDMLDSLRRALLRASVGGGTGGPDRRRRFKNAFGLHDGDWKAIWDWNPRGELPLVVGPHEGFAAQLGAPRPTFSVYVYDPEDIPALKQLTRGGSFCKLNQWGMEVVLHDWFLSCPCRTDDPAKADFFFVPHYTACLINHEDTFPGCDTKQLCLPSTALFEEVLRASPHYTGTDGGRDHIFVWGSGMGADGPFATWRKWVPNAIFLMTETELWNPYHNISTPSFSPHKDIIIPGKLNLEDMRGLTLTARPMSRREHLGHFIGWPRPPHASIMEPKLCADASCPLNVRSVLLALHKEPDMHVDVDVPYIESFTGLTNSIFCFVPRGKSAWSSRYFQTFFAGCIPVLLNDLYEPPFGELGDVRQSVIKWPMDAVPELITYLRELVQEQPEVVNAMQEAGAEWRCWYAWPPSWLEWSWTDLNKSKFNITCGTYHQSNAFVAVTRLLAPKATSARHKFFWPGKRSSLV